jgi:hypothetical protein
MGQLYIDYESIPSCFQIKVTFRVPGNKYVPLMSKVAYNYSNPEDQEFNLQHGAFRYVIL